MIQNNLDPEVAENPDALVVYGGIGKAARNWDVLRRDPRRAARAAARRDAAGAERQAGRRVPHARRCAARADRQLEPGAEVGDLGALRRARSQGPDDVRPDDRRLVDLHRQPGHRAGHLRDLRRGRPAALRRRPGGTLDPDRRPRRHGRRAAAGRDLRRRRVADHRVPAAPHRLPPAHPLPRRAGERASTTRWRASRRCTAAKEARSIGLLGNAAEILPELVRARRSRPDLVTDQTRRTISINGYLPPGWSVERWHAAQADPAQHAELRDAAAASCAVHVQAMLAFQQMGVPTVDYGNNIRQVAFDAGVAERVRHPRLRAGLHPAAVLPRQRSVPLGRAVGRSGGHPQDRREDEGAVPRRHRTCTAGSTWPASASPSRACRRASAGSASASATAPAWRSTRWSGRAS